MSSSETSDDRERFINSARNGQVEKVIEFSNKFRNDSEVLSEALVESCGWGHLDKVKWLMEHTAADVNYKNGLTTLTAACGKNHLDIVKYLVETCHADFNLPDSYGNTTLTEVCRYFSVSVSMYLLCEVSDLNVNIIDSVGNTALHLAVWCSNDHNTQLN